MAGSGEGHLKLEYCPPSNLPGSQRGGRFIDLIERVALRDHGVQVEVTILLPFQEAWEISIWRTGTANAADETLLVD